MYLIGLIYSAEKFVQCMTDVNKYLLNEQINE